MSFYGDNRSGAYFIVKDGGVMCHVSSMRCRRLKEGMICGYEKIERGEEDSNDGTYMLCEECVVHDEDCPNLTPSPS
jgi:hypothetical protein